MWVRSFHNQLWPIATLCVDIWLFLRHKQNLCVRHSPWPSWHQRIKLFIWYFRHLRHRINLTVILIVVLWQGINATITACSGINTQFFWKCFALRSWFLDQRFQIFWVLYFWFEIIIYWLFGYRHILSLGCIYGLLGLFGLFQCLCVGQRSDTTFWYLFWLGNINLISFIYSLRFYFLYSL